MHPIISLNVELDAIQLMKPVVIFCFASPLSLQMPRICTHVCVSEPACRPHSRFKREAVSRFLPMHVRVHVHAHARVDTLGPGLCASRLECAAQRGGRICEQTVLFFHLCVAAECYAHWTATRARRRMAVQSDQIRRAHVRALLL